MRGLTGTTGAVTQISMTTSVRLMAQTFKNRRLGPLCLAALGFLQAPLDFFDGRLRAHRLRRFVGLRFKRISGHSPRVEPPQHRVHISPSGVEQPLRDAGARVLVLSRAERDYQSITWISLGAYPPHPVARGPEPGSTNICSARTTVMAGLMRRTEGRQDANAGDVEVKFTRVRRPHSSGFPAAAKGFELRTGPAPPVCAPHP